MITRLERPVRRTVDIKGTVYVITIHADGVRLVRKGRRKGIEVTWDQILDGEVVLDGQLSRSLATPTRGRPILHR